MDTCMLWRLPCLCDKGTICGCTSDTVVKDSNNKEVEILKNCCSVIHVHVVVCLFFTQIQKKDSEIKTVQFGIPASLGTNH